MNLLVFPFLVAACSVAQEQALDAFIEEHGKHWGLNTSFSG